MHTPVSLFNRPLDSKPKPGQHYNGALVFQLEGASVFFYFSRCRRHWVIGPGPLPTVKEEEAEAEAAAAEEQEEEAQEQQEQFRGGAAAATSVVGIPRGAASSGARARAHARAAELERRNGFWAEYDADAPPATSSAFPASFDPTRWRCWSGAFVCAWVRACVRCMGRAKIGWLPVAHANARSRTNVAALELRVRATR